MKINFLEKIIGSGLYTGYIPVASGTFGSAAALLIYLIPGAENPVLLIFLISFFFVVGLPLGDKFEKPYGKDPAQFTLDEFVGMWISLLFIPKVIWFIAAAFVIWRVLDVLKPFPANAAEKLKGGLGIMLDDVISGVYTFLIMQVLLFFYNKFIN